MKSVDKNDVDISKLFNWGTSFELKAPSGDVVTFYLRVVGDADLNIAKTFALRESAELRKKLKKKGTSERDAFIPDVISTEKDILIELILSLIVKEITDKVRNGLEFPFPREPNSDASLEEFEKFQEEVDSYPEMVEESVRKEMDDAIEKQRKDLNKKTMKQLISLYEKEMINRICETEMYNKFQDMCVYLGVYKDSEYKERMFKSVDQFNNLPTPIKEELIIRYSMIDLNVDDLKKLPEATP
jgi:hypothetical protein